MLGEVSRSDFLAVRPHVCALADAPVCHERLFQAEIPGCEMCTGPLVSFEREFLRSGLLPFRDEHVPRAFPTWTVLHDDRAVLHDLNDSLAVEVAHDLATDSGRSVVDSELLAREPEFGFGVADFALGQEFLGWEDAHERDEVTLLPILESFPERSAGDDERDVHEGVQFFSLEDLDVDSGAGCFEDIGFLEKLVDVDFASVVLVDQLSHFSSSFSWCLCAGA